jgi:hypothetical protein
MALLDGKQLRNQSTELGKLSGSGIVSFTAATMSFTSGSVLTTATANIVNPTDVVNKEYVDSVAAGLDPKESVAYTTTGNITLSGTSTQTNGDWSQALSVGDRILVKNQTDKTENGIYTADSAGWSRAEDHDGTPANEVTLGNFTFVEYGTLAGSGYVLHATDSSNSPIITPGTDEQEWTLYSSAGAYTAGTGLNLNNGEFEIDATGVAAGSYGSADSITTFTVNDEGQLTTAADTQISIVASQVTDFDLAAETAIFEDPNFVDGTTIDFTVTAGDSVTAEVIDSSLTSAKLDTGSNGGATAGYVLSVDNNGDFKWKLDEGDISAVDAGAGLSGGGTAGDLTLSVNTSNGLSIDGDDVVLGGTLSQSTTIAGGNQELFLGLTSSQITFLHIDAIQAQERYTAPGAGVLTIDLNPGGRVESMDNTSVGGGVSTFEHHGSDGLFRTQTDGGASSTDIILGDAYLQLMTNDNGTQSGFIFQPKSSGSSGNSADYMFVDGRSGGSQSGLQYADDYSADFTDNSLVTKKYVDSLDAAQITGVEAGNGLIGGGTAGTVALNLGGTVSTDIDFDFGGSNGISFGYGGPQKLASNFSIGAGTFSVFSFGDSENPGPPTANIYAGKAGFIAVGADGNVFELGTQSSKFSDHNNQKGLEYGGDYSANFTDNSLVTKKYVDSLDAAQITGVDAGAGLSGGGTAGTVALSVNTSNGLSVDGDDVVLGGTLSQSTTIAGGDQELFLGLTSSQITFLHIDAIQAQERYTAPGADVVTVDKNPGGFKLKNTNPAGVPSMEANFNNGDIDMHARDATGNHSVFAVSANQIQAVSNQGNGQLTLVGGQTQIVGQETVDINGGTLSVTASDELALNGPSGSVLGMNINGTSLVSHNGSGTLDLVGSNVTLEGSGHTQVNGSTINVVGSGDVNLVGGGGNVLTLGTASNTFSDNLNSKGIEYGADYSANFTDRSLVDKAYVEARTSQPVYQSATSSVATGNTGISLTSTPNDYSRVEVYVNGQLQDLTENTTGDCYFGQAGTILSSLTSGDSLFWNSANAGFELSATDVIKVHYQA